MASPSAQSTSPLANIWARVSNCLASFGWTEKPSGVVLRQAQGLTATIPRADVAKLEITPLSMMPQELEKTMSLQELADLLAHLKGE